MNEGLFAGLPEILFAVKDAAEVEREILRAYEQASGRSLAPGDPVRLFLLTIASVIIQQRALIDFTGKQNLLAYSSEGYLDHLGALLGVYRIPAAAAQTTLRVELSTPRPDVTVIPAGTRATSGSGEAVFALADAMEIPAGEVEGVGVAYSLTPGEAGNGYLPGQIHRLVDPLPWVKSVSNTTASSGGSDVEDDENLRSRIQIAPEKFSVAGPTGAYEYWARTAHQDIIDVAVVGPPDIPPGEVEIYPLMAEGQLPTQDILDAVDAICNAEDIRPLTDRVRVLPPTRVPYVLHVRYWIDRARATEARAIQQSVDSAVHGWIAWQRSRIGRDILPDELVRRVIEAGARRVEVLSPSYRPIGPSELAVCPDGAQVIYGGLEDA